MAATEVDIGYGTIVRVENAAGAGTFYEYLEYGDVDYPDSETDDHEATHQKSPGGFKEFVQGLSDGGTLELPFNFIPGNSDDVFNRTWKGSRQRRLMQIDPGDGGPTCQFLAYVKNWKRSRPVNGVSKATLTVKVAGEPVDI